MKEFRATVTGKGELSIPAELFSPHAPPSFFAVGCSARPWAYEECDGVRITLSTYSKKYRDVSTYRRTYLPAPRSKAIRVSVRTEFSAAHVDPKRFAGMQFVVKVLKPRYMIHMEGAYYQIDIRKVGGKIR